MIYFILPLVFIVLMEVVPFIVYGGFMTDESRLIKRLNRPCFSSKGMIHFWHYDFISREQHIFSKWYIQGEGMIYRWSKLSKMIDDKYKQLRETEETDISTVKLTPKYYEKIF